MFFLGVGMFIPSRQVTVVPCSPFTIPPEFAIHVGPLPAWEWIERTMRVEEKVLKSVVFVGNETPRGFIPNGTAVIGLVELDPNMGNTVLITAAHVLKQIPGETFSIRVNRRDGSAEVRRINKKSAITFKDKAIDLAVVPDSLDPSIYDIAPFQVNSENWARAAQEFGEPSPGDEVCVVGLYTTHYGHARNAPVVRIGHIAALPNEKVMTDVGYVHAYLIECHSIAGLSGSPVYVTIPRIRIRDGEIQHYEDAYYLPLGILIGHHMIRSKEAELAVPQFQQQPEDRGEDESNEMPLDERRTGFAVVLPIQHVFQIFESDLMKKIFREAADDLKAKSGFRPASADSPALEVGLPSNDVPPSDRGAFTRLLNAAARKPEPKD
jgi:hypothetical protein